MTLEELEQKVLSAPGARDRVEALTRRMLAEQGMIQLGSCKYCERPLYQKRKGRDKVFCDDVCRDSYREEAGSDATA